MGDYKTQLKDPRWQKFKALVHIRDNWTCRHCGAVDKTLVAHHCCYKGAPWEAEFERVITLCMDCHNDYHDDEIVVSPDSTPPESTVESILDALIAHGAYPKLSDASERGFIVRGDEMVPMALMLRVWRNGEQICEYLKSR